MKIGNLYVSRFFCEHLEVLSHQKKFQVSSIIRSIRPRHLYFEGNRQNPWFLTEICSIPYYPMFPIFWLLNEMAWLLECDMNTLHVTWIHDMWHGYMTCDMGTWLVTWIHDFWHVYITFDRIVRLLFRTSIWAARYFTLHDLCHDTWYDKWHVTRDMTHDMWHNTWYVIWHEVISHKMWLTLS